MFPLDDSTARRISEVIVDLGGPYERKSYELEPLLHRAGWADVPEYDLSSRVAWLTDRLIERKQHRSDIERLLCRVCDPLEYDDGMESAEEFRCEVNTKLAAEQLVVTYVSGRPVIGALGSDGRSTEFSAPTDLERRLPLLIKDRMSVELLLRRFDETVACAASGAHTLAIIGVGSFVEGLLYSVLSECPEEVAELGFIRRSNKKDVVVTAENATLQELIDMTHELGLLQLDAHKFMHTVRDYRNFVHPRKELAEQPGFDQDSVMLCWAPVRALLNDLEEQLGSK